MDKHKESKRLDVVDIPEELQGIFLADAIEAATSNDLPVDLADDWRQEMFLGIWERIGTHNGSLTSRKTFMIRLARWRLRELVREQVRARVGSVYRPIDSTCFRDDETEEYASFTRNIRDGAAHTEHEAITLELGMETVVNSLHPRFQRVYRLLAQHSSVEIATLLGKSKDMIHRYIREIRNAFVRAEIYPPNMRASERAEFCSE